MKIFRSDFSTITLDPSKGVAVKESKRSLNREIEVLQLLHGFDNVPKLIDVLSSHKIILEYIDGPSRSLGRDELSTYRLLQNRSHNFIQSTDIPLFSEVVDREISELNFLLGVSEKFGPTLNKLLNLMIEVKGNVSKYSSGEKVLCHGDLHAKNSVMGNEGLVFLDWEDCFLGEQYLGYSSFFLNISEYLTFVEKNYAPKLVQKILYSEILVWALSKTLFLKDYIVFSLEDRFSDQNLADVSSEIDNMKNYKHWVRN